MSFTPLIEIGRTATNNAMVIATDVSVGSDSNITQRRITITDCQNTNLVVSGTITSYNPWPLLTNPIYLNLLTTDTAVTITVQWLDVSNVVLYSFTDEYCLANYSKSFLYYLGQLQNTTPSIVQDSNYSNNAADMWATLRGAINAVEEADDISNSQNLLNICTNYRLNQNLYF